MWSLCRFRPSSSWTRGTSTNENKTKTKTKIDSSSSLRYNICKYIKIDQTTIIDFLIICWLPAAMFEALCNNQSIKTHKDVPQELLVGYIKTKTNIERIIINPAYSSIKHKCCIIVHGWIKRTIQKTLGPLCLLLARSWPCCIWRNRRALKAKCNEPLLQSCRYIYNLSSIVTHFGRMNSWITTRV